MGSLLYVCLSVYHMCAVPEEDVRCPRTGVPDSYELLSGNQSPGPLEEQLFILNP